MASHAHLSVKQRVDQMILGGSQQFGCSLSINQSNRTAEQAQQFHICHMFLHNYFKHLKPKHLATDGRTIAWLHLSDPNVDWVFIPHPEKLFLRTRDHKPAEKQIVEGRKVWAAGREPDKQATTHAMTQFLKKSHVTSMAAPGKDMCGEPCGCGGHASKHITGLACDVSGMDFLGQQILGKQKAYHTADEAVDHFLAQYGLWRPLAHLEGKAREAWHLEALPPHHAQLGHSHSSHHHARHTHLKGDPHLHMKLKSERMVCKEGC